jgi:UDP-glucuronate 4-epimerase
MRVFVTGSAGFIGFHLARRLLSEGHDVLGFDGITAYYDVALKKRRHSLLQAQPRFTAVEAMLEDRNRVNEAVRGFGPDIVVHLAAQAGVRHSLDHPEAYLSANVVGTMHLLEALRVTPPRHLLMASTSSVYGGNARMPFVEADRTDFPISLYAASKKAGEAVAHSYSHLYGLPVTCFRFFTVYGPWGRPDMALFKFVAAIESGKPIDVYGEGRMRRDFTYVDDLIEAVSRLIGVVPVVGAPVDAAGVVDSLSPVAPWRSVNIAQGEPVGLMKFIDVIERIVGREAIKTMLPMQPGDVADTWANPGLLRALTGYVPGTSVEAGVKEFVDWHRQWTRGLA